MRSLLPRRRTVHSILGMSYSNVAQANSSPYQMFVCVRGKQRICFFVGSLVFNLFRQTQMLKEQGERQTAGLHSGCCKRTSTSMTMAYSNLCLCHKLGHAQSSKHYAWRTRKAEAVWTCALWIRVLTSIRQAWKYVWTHKIDLYIISNAMFFLVLYIHTIYNKICMYTYIYMLYWSILQVYISPHTSIGEPVNDGMQFVGVDLHIV